MKTVPINPKLMALPIDALYKLKAEIEAAAAQRRYEVFQVGRLVTFPDKANVMVIARIEKFGPKRMQCQVLDAKGFPVYVGGKWRVSPEYCQPVFGDPFAKPALHHCAQRRTAQLRRQQRPGNAKAPKRRLWT